MSNPAPLLKRYFVRCKRISGTPVSVQVEASSQAEADRLVDATRPDLYVCNLSSLPTTRRERGES